MIDETEQAQAPAPAPAQAADPGLSDWGRTLRQHIGSQPGVMDLQELRSDGSFTYRFRGQRFHVSVRRIGG